MQLVSARIWTRVAVSISLDGNHYTTGTNLSSDDDLESKLVDNIMDRLLTIWRTDNAEIKAWGLSTYCGRFKEYLVPTCCRRL